MFSPQHQVKPSYKLFYFNRWFSWSCRSDDCSTFFWIASCWYWRCVVIIAIFLKLSSECKMASSCSTMFRAAWPSSSELREPFSTCLVRAITSVPQVVTFSVSSPFTDWPNRACESGGPVAIASAGESLRGQWRVAGAKRAAKRKLKRRRLFSNSGKKRKGRVVP